MLSLFILIPLLFLVIFNLPFGVRRQKIAFMLTCALALGQSLIACLCPLLYWAGHFDPLASFFIFNLSLDGLSLIMLFTIGLISFVSLLVSQNTFVLEEKKFQFINLLLLAITGMNTVVLVRDVFSLYVFIEITAMATLVLMSLEKNKFAIEGVFKYVVLSAIASVFMLSSIAFFILLAGDTSFAGIHNAFYVSSNKFLLNFSVGLFLCGLLIKSGLVPFHGWVLDAYSDSQASISVLLAGIVTKISGVYALLRLFSSVFILSASLQNVLMFIGTLSILFAAFAALTQGDIKRMLSYSSISQIGYIVLGLGCATPLAFVGAVFHFFNHAVFKSLLFTNAAALEKKLGSTDIAIIAGLGSSLPVTSLSSLIGSLSAAGVPPFCGFWSKLIIIVALWVSGKFVYAAIALIASVLTLAYFLSFQRMVFFIKGQNISEDKESVGFGIKFSEILLSIITIGGGIAFPFIFNKWLLPLIKQ